MPVVDIQPLRYNNQIVIYLSVDIRIYKECTAERWIMHILFFQWYAFMQKGIEKALKKLNISYDVFYYDMKEWDEDAELERRLMEHLKNSKVKYDCIFSVNFIPMLSEVCVRYNNSIGAENMRYNGDIVSMSAMCDRHKDNNGLMDYTYSADNNGLMNYNCSADAGEKCVNDKFPECNKIKYISWVYDCPVNIRRTESLKNDCNIIYFFDRIQSESYRKQGVNGARHMPLAVDTDVFAEVIDNYNGAIDNYNGTIDNCDSVIDSYNGAIDKYSGAIDKYNVVTDNYNNELYDCDVALVGKLYKSDYQYIAQYQDDYTRGYLEGIVSTQGKIYGGYVIDDCMNDSVMKRINENFARVSDGKYSVIKPEVTYALATEVTGRERYTALALLQNRCKVNLYSTDKDDRLPGINQCGPVDYYNQMPLAFDRAKINLNISLKVIQSGIPLRVFDVLGCGGFLITNYQHEIAECFEDGRELVIYEDIPDLITKVEYYLKHDDERRKIAMNGYEKVRSECTFERRMRGILEL